MPPDHELIVIGSGPAARCAAIQAAKLGKRVLVVEGSMRLGGVSIHTGKIPSKTLRETALNLSRWRERGFCGLSYRVKKEICRGDLPKPEFTGRIAPDLSHKTMTGSVAPKAEPASGKLAPQVTGRPLSSPTRVIVRWLSSSSAIVTSAPKNSGSRSGWRAGSSTRSFFIRRARWPISRSRRWPSARCRADGHSARSDVMPAGVIGSPSALLMAASAAQPGPGLPRKWLSG